MQACATARSAPAESTRTAGRLGLRLIHNPPCAGLYDSLKRAYVALRGAEPGVAASIGFGVLSSFAGQLVAFPLETVARRLQVSCFFKDSALFPVSLAAGLQSIQLLKSSLVTSQWPSRTSYLETYHPA